MLELSLRPVSVHPNFLFLTSASSIGLAAIKRGTGNIQHAYDRSLVRLYLTHNDSHIDNNDKIGKDRAELTHCYVPIDDIETKINNRERNEPCDYKTLCPAVIANQEATHNFEFDMKILSQGVNENRRGYELSFY